MCGIVGYVGRQEAAPILLDGLERLEYRGYDSAGIAVCGDGVLRLCKKKGRVAALRELTHDGGDLPGTLGIGHTRWATHGEPNDVNAHPHMSQSGKFAVVHNGIIENFITLKEELQQKGYVFQSETDTEVVAQLLDYYYSDCGDIFRGHEPPAARGGRGLCPGHHLRRLSRPAGGRPEGRPPLCWASAMGRTSSPPT